MIPQSIQPRKTMADGTGIPTVTQSRPNSAEAAALAVRRKMRAISLLAGLPILCILNNFQSSLSLLWPPQSANDINTTDTSSTRATDASTDEEDGDPTSGRGERINDEDDDADQMQCVICLHDVSKGKSCRVLAECGHGFHVDCIDAWLMQNFNCPLCRRSVGSTPAGKHQQLRSNEGDAQEQYYEIVISSILSFLDHLWTWFLNPLEFDRSCQDYRAYL